MDEEQTPSAPDGVYFCFLCTKAGPIVLCTIFSRQGRCQEHRRVRDTELPVSGDHEAALARWAANS